MANTISLSSSTTPWLALSPPPPHVRCWTLLARSPRWSNRGASVLEAIARAREAAPGPRAERAAPGQVRSGVVHRAGRRLARHGCRHGCSPVDPTRAQAAGGGACTGGGGRHGAGFPRGGGEAPSWQRPAFKPGGRQGGCPACNCTVDLTVEEFQS